MTAATISHDHLFAFENDFVRSLRCVPMAVRFKLDRCEIKLTLKQWSRLRPAERQMLLKLRCDDPQAVAAYRRTLLDMIALRSEEPAKGLPEPVSPVWAGTEIPPAVQAFAATKGLAPISPGAWTSLSALERYTLVKLSRDNHDNVNFVPALREFGLLAVRAVK